MQQKLVSGTLIVLIGLSLCASKKMEQRNDTAVFNHVYLGVHNLDTSLLFYTKAFDLKVTDRFTELQYTQTDTVFKRAVKVAFLKFPGQDLVFELAERPDKNDSTRYGNLFQHVGVEVKNIQTAFDRFKNAGGKVIAAIRRVKTNSPGGLEIKQAYMKGPDGETIELIELISGHY